MSSTNESRRNFVKRGAYVAPVVLTLAAAPAFAKAGSVKPGKPGKPPKDDKPGKGHGRNEWSDHGPRGGWR